MSSVSTRERLVDAAAELFAQRGFAGASTRRLGAAAGANIATIAYHFGDKEGLYHAALERMYERLLDLPLPVDVEGEPEERIRQVVDVIYRFCHEHRDAVRLLLRHVLENGSLPQPIQDRWTPRLLERADAVQQALELPELLDRRFELLSLNHLIARYAVSQDKDLLPFAGNSEPQKAVIAHLGEVACRLLL